MEPLGRFPRVLKVLPREKIEGNSRNFLNANPRPYPRPDQRPKTRWPWGFLVSLNIFYSFLKIIPISSE